MPQRAQRTSKVAQHLANLDVLRGFAIFGVLLFHSLDAVWRSSGIGIVKSCPVPGALDWMLIPAGTASLVSGKAILSAAWSKWLVILGAWSYSLYLIHQLLLQKVGEVMKTKFHVSDFKALGTVWLGAILIVPVAGVLFLLLEKPSIAAGHWLRRKLRLAAS